MVHVLIFISFRSSFFSFTSLADVYCLRDFFFTLPEEELHLQLQDAASRRWVEARHHSQHVHDEPSNELRWRLHDT